VVRRISLVGEVVGGDIGVEQASLGAEGESLARGVGCALTLAASEAGVGGVHVEDESLGGVLVITGSTATAGWASGNRGSRSRCRSRLGGSRSGGRLGGVRLLGLRGVRLLRSMRFLRLGVVRFLWLTAVRVLGMARSLRLSRGGRGASIRVGGEADPVEEKIWAPWVPIEVALTASSTYQQLLKSDDRMV